MGWISAMLLPGYDADEGHLRPAHNYFIGSDFRQAEIEASAAIRERSNIWRFRLENAEEQKCIICGGQADTLWAGECRTEGARPYCTKCLAKAKQNLRAVLMEELKKRK